ncbi:phosphotransferase family protein [Brevibacterium litoralis]|uniref:phosphotransferase family protein n=1 Tax=Brevibacterium litoralis TaxID=3138935 RepID=UPI0032EDD8E2
MTADAAAEHARAAGVDLATLESWLAGQLGGGRMGSHEFLTGGTQNVLLGFDWEDASGTRRLIYRGPPVNKRKNSDTIMLREARVLEALTGSEVPHPGFVAACDDMDVLGNAFFVMEAVDGYNGVSDVPEHVRADLAWQHEAGLEHARSVAALGNVDHLAVGLEGFGKPDRWLERQPGRWVGQLKSYEEIEEWAGLDHEGAEAIPRWLEEHMPRVAPRSQVGIIHGDCHAGNILFRRDRPGVAALVDWELSTLGDPLLDLGHLLASTYTKAARDDVAADGTDGDGGQGASGADADAGTVTSAGLPGVPTKDEIVAAYGEVSSRDVDEVDFYHVLACFRFGSILEGSQARAAAGLAPEEVGRRLHERTVSLFDQAMGVIDG